VIKQVYLVVGVVCLPEITYPGELRYQIFHGDSLTQRLHITVTHHLLHGVIKLRTKIKK